MYAQQSCWLVNHWRGVLGWLTLIPMAWCLRWIMRKTHPAHKLSTRIVVDSVATGSIVVGTKTVCPPIVTIRNFWYFAIEFEPACFDMCFSGYSSFFQTSTHVNPSKVARGKAAQIAIPTCQLTGEKIDWMDVTFHNPGCVDLIFSAKLRFKTWFGSFDQPISLLVRCSILRN